MSKEQRIRERIDQAMTELEQAPRMLEHLQKQLAIHRDSCHACLSRGYCEQFSRMAYTIREWDRIAYWTEFHKMEESEEA